MLANIFRDRFEICPEIREQARSYRNATEREADFYSPIQYGSGGYPEVVEHVEEIRGALEAILGILGHEIFQ